jgi:membrane protein implicated in regulation of membrane protease activity
MLTIYLACLLFGGVLLAVAILLGGDHDLGSDAGFDLHTDMDHGGFDLHSDMDVHADVSTDMHTDFHAHAESTPSGEGMGAAAQWLSFRNIIFFIAFFGLTGTALTLVSGPVVAAVGAVLMGFLASGLSHRIFQYLRQSESGEGLQDNDLQGLRGQVAVTVSRVNKGKISIVANDRTLQMLAVTAEEASKEEYRPGETVTIVRIEGGLAHIAGEDFIC